MRIEEYRDLWRRVAWEFRVPGAIQMEVGGDPILTTKMLPIKGVGSEIQGSAAIFRPTFYPPILQFRVDGLVEESAIPNEPAVHYEWVVRIDEDKLDVALHFHCQDAGRNQKWLNRVSMPPPFEGEVEVIECEPEEFPTPAFTGYRYRLSLQHELLPLRAAQVMEHLIANTVNRLLREWE